jgi:Flp pilus assembly protein TadG
MKNLFANLVKHFVRPQRGQTLVEFSLAATISFALLLGLMDTAQIFWRYVSLAQATGVAARYAVVHGAKSSAPLSAANTTPLKTAVVNQVRGINAGDLTVNATFSPDNNPGSRVDVSLSYTVHPLTMLSVRNLSFTLTNHASAMIEN